MYRTDFYFLHQKANVPEIFRARNGFCESKRELAHLRIARLIACNVFDKAISLMNHYNIDINCLLRDEIPNAYFYIGKCKSFMDVAITYSSFDTIRKMIKAGANLLYDISRSSVLDLYSYGFIPQIMNICKVKYNTTLMYQMGVSCYNGLFYEDKRGITSRFALINKFLLSSPQSCNAYKITRRDRLEMLHTNKGVSKCLIEPKREIWDKLKLGDKLYYDNFFGNFMTDFRNNEPFFLDKYKYEKPKKSKEAKPKEIITSKSVKNKSVKNKISKKKS